MIAQNNGPFTLTLISPSRSPTVALPTARTAPGRRPRAGIARHSAGTREAPPQYPPGIAAVSEKHPAYTRPRLRPRLRPRWADTHTTRSTKRRPTAGPSYSHPRPQLASRLFALKLLPVISWLLYCLSTANLCDQYIYCTIIFNPAPPKSRSCATHVCAS